MINSTGIYIVKEAVTVGTIRDYGHDMEVGMPVTLQADRVLRVTGFTSLEGRRYVTTEREPDVYFDTTHIKAEKVTPEMQSGQTGVYLFNKNMGRTSHTMPNLPVQALSEQAALIAEEVGEILEAIEDYAQCLPGDVEEKWKHLYEMRDGIADTLVTTYGLAYVLGIDAHADLQYVNMSNNSKFCDTFEQACATCDQYAELLNLQTYIQDLPDGRFAIRTREFEQEDTTGKKWPPNKLVKGSGYWGPEFDKQGLAGHTQYFARIGVKG